MSDGTHIEWTDATWNPITGCAIVSPGCTNCYAMKLAGTRLKHIPSRVGLTKDTKAGPVWTGQVRFNEEWLTQPLKWKRPRRIFVCAHGDLFAEGVPDEWIDRVFAVMALSPYHTFQVLTKRPARMREYLGNRTVRRVYELACDLVAEGDIADVVLIAPGVDQALAPPGQRVFLDVWPLNNVWLGVSVEDQKRADERIPLLLETPAAVRFISAEPLLGPIDLNRLHQEFDGGLGHSWESSLNGKRFDPWSDGDIGGQPKLDWVIVGGESGPGARPMHPGWAQSLRDQCQAAGVAFFFKQWGAWADSSAIEPKPRASEDRIFLASGEVVGAGGRVGRHADGFVDPDWREKGAAWMSFVGKKAAGRLLDGVEHSAMPGAR